MNIVEKAREFVKEECEKESANYGRDVFNHHFKQVVKYSLEIGKEKGADLEILEIAGWMHDIGSVMNGRKEHHITGTKIAEEKLKEWKYSPEKIEKVKKCILNHRGSQNLERESLEEKIISDADGMSAFDAIAGNFKGVFMFEGMDQEEAKKAVMEKLENKYNQLFFNESKERIKEKYEAAKILFG